MKEIFALVAAVFAFSTPSFAQEECSTLTDNIERLNCYDAKFGVLSAEDIAETIGEEPEEDVIDLGNWIKRVDVSELTDDKNIFLVLESENQIRGTYGGSGAGRIWIRCMENTTAMILEFNDHFMSDIQGYGRVEYRIDDLALASVSTSASTNNKSLGLWRGSSSIPFIKRLLGHDQLIVRATPFNESPMTLTFDIRGIDQAIVDVRETCSW